MIGDESVLLSDILGESEHAMLDALPRLKDVASRSGEDRGSFIVKVAAGLDDSALGDRERHLRLQRVVAILRLDRFGFEQLAITARHLGPSMQSAVVGLLPADLRPIAYGVAAGPNVSASPSGEVPIAVRRTVADPNVSFPSLSDGEYVEPFPNLTVLLLSTIEQEVNRHLLEGAGFQVVNVSSVQDLGQWLTGSADVCAFVVDHSFLVALSATEQTDFIRTLASYSTFAWIRIDGSGDELKLTDAEVFAIAKECRCRLTSLCSHELLVATESKLHEREMSHVYRAARLLSHPTSGLLRLRNLDALAQQVLVAAAATYADERFEVSPGQVGTIDVTLLQGGRSGDQVFVVRVDQRGKPVLAKVGSRNSVVEEARRFRLFLQDTYDYIPQLFFHREAALIISQLYTDDFEFFEPAPTLESCLNNLWQHESGFGYEKPLLPSPNSKW